MMPAIRTTATMDMDTMDTDTMVTVMVVMAWLSTSCTWALS